MAELAVGETVVTEQFAVRYLNHRRGNKPVTLGLWDADFDTTDIVRDLRQQGYEPEVMRRTITRVYSDWEPAP